MPKNFSLFSIVTVAIASAFTSALIPTRNAQAQFANSGNLTAEVSALRNKTGQVCFSLFDSSKGFPNDDDSIVETKCVSLDPQAEDDMEASVSDDAAEVADSAVMASEGSDVELSDAVLSEVELSEVGVADAEASDVNISNAAISGAEASEAAAADTEETHASVSVTFESLPLGTYAVSVFHDENEDGEINQGGFGIPLEGFGFSKNPPITTRAPEFSETAVIVVGADTTTEIELIYY